MAAGNLCVSVGYGGDLNIAKTRAKEAGNGVEVEVLAAEKRRWYLGGFADDSA